MSIRDIRVHPYKKLFGGNEEEHVLWTDYIITKANELLPSAEYKQADFYNMDGEPQNLGAGNHKRLVIMADTVQTPGRKGDAIEGGMVINGTTYSFDKKMVAGGIEGSLLLKSTEGVSIAQYSKNRHELSILFDLFSLPLEEGKELFNYIMAQLEEKHFLEEIKKHSWIHSPDKASLTQSFVQRAQEAVRSVIQNDTYNLTDTEQRIESIKRDLKRDYDRVKQLSRQILNAENSIAGAGDAIVAQVDNIVALEKVTDLHIKNGIVEMFLSDMYFYDTNGKRYYLGNMKVSIDIHNTNVKFFNLTNPRPSFWSNRDAHPHVNGSSGAACLGSVASTIAELCSGGEIYALALICIDFLEAANLDDSAGSYASNWDEVNEAGEVINPGINRRRH